MWMIHHEKKFVFVFFLEWVQQKLFWGGVGGGGTNSKLNLYPLTFLQTPSYTTGSPRTRLLLYNREPGNEATPVQQGSPGTRLLLYNRGAQERGYSCITGSLGMRLLLYNREPGNEATPIQQGAQERGYSYTLLVDQWLLIFVRTDWYANNMLMVELAKPCWARYII